MTKKHLVFIINPKSGVDRQKAIQDAIDTHLNHDTYSYEILHTEYAKHGTELAKDAASKNAYAVVAVGGDGSVNDIVAGLAGTPTALAIIPKGSGNGVARSFKIPLNVEGAIEVLNGGKSVMMDVAYANERPYISNAGVAFDALISEKFAKSIRRGLLAYSVLVTKHMWSYKEQEWNIKIDGKELKEKAFIISVANGKQFGYNFKIAPKASWTDGKLDVVVVRKFPKFLGGALVLRALIGTILRSPYVDHYLAEEVEIHSPHLNLMQTDGDAYACADTVRYTIKQGHQKVLIP